MTEDNLIKVKGVCRKSSCDWEVDIDEAEGGQTYIGTLCYHMRRHEEEHNQKTTKLEFYDGVFQD